MTIGDILIRFVADRAGLNSELDKGIADSEQRGQTFGDRFSERAKMAMVGAGAAVGAFVAGSVQEFSKFDDQMRTVYSILPGISQQAMSEMEGQVKGLAVEMGRLPEDIIPGLYDALSSGIPQDNVFAFMESASKAAVAGGADTQQVVQVLSSTINAFGLDAANTEQLTDSFFNAVNRGVTTFPELAASMSQVTPTAAAMGLSIEDVLAAVTAMTLQGTPTAQAVTGINASLVALQRTTPPMEQALKNLGFATGQAGLEALGYQGLMEALAGQAEAMGVPLIELTGRMEGSAAMLQLTGDNAAKSNELLATFGDTAGLTGKAFETMEGGIGGAARRIAAQVKVMAIDIGEKLEGLGPIFTAFGPTMGRLLGAGLGGLAGFIVPKVIDVFRGLLTNPAVIGSQTAAGTASAEQYSIGFRAGQALRGAIESLWNGVKGLANRAIGLAGTAAGAVYAGAVKVGETVADAVRTGWDALKNSGPVRRAATIAGGIAGGIYAAAAGAVEKMADLIRAGWDALMSKPALKRAVQLAGAAAGAVYGIAAGAVEMLVDKLGLAWEAIRTHPRMAPMIDKAGKTSGTAYGKAFGIAMVAAVVLFGIPALMDELERTKTKIAEGKEAVDKSIEGFLGGLPSRAEVEAKLEGLRALPSTLDPIKSAFFSIDAAGVQTKWREAIGALESYLSGPAVAIMEGNANTLVQPFMDETGRILSSWVEPTAQQIASDMTKVQGTFLDQSGRMVDVWVSTNGQRIVMQYADLAQQAATTTASTYAEYLEQFWASGAYGPPIPESMFVPSAEVAGETAADAATTSFEQAPSWRDPSKLAAVARAYILGARMDAAGYEIGTTIPSSIGEGVQSNLGELNGAMDRLKDLLKNGLTPEEMATKVLGAKWIKLFQQGITSEIPGTREATFRLGVEGLEALSRSTIGTDEAKRIAQIAAGLYADGWDSRSVLVALAAQGIGEEALKKLGAVAGWDDEAVEDALDYVSGMQSKEGVAGGAGEDLGTAALNAANGLPWERGGTNSAGSWVGSFMGMIRDSEGRLRRVLHDSVDGYLHGASPPPKGPLHTIDEGGRNVGRAWADGLVDGVRGRARALRDALLMFDPGDGATALESGFASILDPIRHTDGTIRVAVEHTVHADAGALPPGTSDERIADYLNRGFEASGFGLRLAHRTSY